MTEPTTDPRIERAERLRDSRNPAPSILTVRQVCDDLIALGRENATLSAAVQQGCAREAELRAEVEELKRINAAKGKLWVDLAKKHAAEVLRAGAAERETARLRERVETLSRLDREASTHVEAVICMRTHFTGNGEYVGWRGLGKALSEALDERDRLRDLAEGMADAWINRPIGVEAKNVAEAVRLFRAAYPKPDGENNAD